MLCEVGHLLKECLRFGIVIFFTPLGGYMVLFVSAKLVFA
jgi:hypothetical protein